MGCTTEIEELPHAEVGQGRPLLVDETDLLIYRKVQDHDGRDDRTAFKDQR